MEEAIKATEERREALVTKAIDLLAKQLRGKATYRAERCLLVEVHSNCR